jgi:hypothetical protein
LSGSPSFSPVSPGRISLSETALKRAREAVNATRRSQGKLAEVYAQLCLAQVLLSTRGLVARVEIESALQTAAETTAEMGARRFEPDLLIARARLARRMGDEGRYRGELSEAHSPMSGQPGASPPQWLAKRFPC